MSVLDVGLVGAGPWAHLVHGPILAAGPETRLVGIWARRYDAAAELATKLGTQAVERYEDLLERCAAVAFCVPPTVQADLAVVAAQRGKALLLEKPLGDTLDEARRLADAVGEAGVVSQLMLTWRYTAGVRAFLAQLDTFEALGGRGWFVSGSILSGPFATPWRLERGALLDLGPHVVDLLDAALGPVVGVRAHGQSVGWIGLLLDHDDGRVSEVSLSAAARIDPQEAGVEVFGRTGRAGVDAAAAASGPEPFAVARREFAAAVACGRPHRLDAQRGLHLQRILAAAELDLADVHGDGRALP